MFLTCITINILITKSCTLVIYSFFSVYFTNKIVLVKTRPNIDFCMIEQHTKTSNLDVFKQRIKEFRLKKRGGCNILTCLTLYGPNSFFRRFSGHNLR